MLTDEARAAANASSWSVFRASGNALFAPLDPVLRGMPVDRWPDVAALNDAAQRRDQLVVNANGEPIRFVPQEGRPARFEDAYEPRIFLRGEVMVRESNWHDLFNALVWMTFPRSKAAINARHYASLSAQKSPQRSALGDALTLFDEDGVVVLSSNARLLELLCGFQWKELFVECREAVRSEMRFLVFGHAMYEKALNPFIGMTAKSVLLPVPADVIQLEGVALNAEADRLLGAYILEPGNLLHGRSLSPLPVLGVPGWWPPNEAAAFYDDTSYFRSGRLGADACGSSPGS